MPRSKSFDANEHLTQALSAMDAQIHELQAKRAQLAAIIGGGKTTTKTATKAPTKAASKGKRTMSPEAKQKISEAQKRRWENAKNAAAPAKKKK